MFATDYPHWDFDAPDQALPSSLAARASSRKIMAENARGALPASPAGAAAGSDGSSSRASTRSRPGTRKIVEVAGRSIGVFNVGGELLRAAQPLPAPGRAALRGAAGRPGRVTSDRAEEYHYSRAGEILRCPWHAWEFDIRTGQSWFDPASVRVRALRR